MADVAAPHRAPGRLYEPTKRAVDLVVAGAALAVLSPLLAVLAVAVRCSSPGPALFRQTRVGRHGRPFTCYKLRTMRLGADDGAHRRLVTRQLTEDVGEPLDGGSFKLAEDPRVTRVGALLRRTSLDELPQLLNVVRGEMSLVGPRPSLEWEAELFDERQRRRFEVPPGITGLWQVSGRSRLSFRQALELDVTYVERRSLGLDLSILVRTVGTVLRGDGAR